MIEFRDGSEAKYTADIIAENMYAQYNPDGEQFLLMESICDQKKDGHAVEKADAYLTINHMYIEWKDEKTSWEKLSSLKESHPVQVAEYDIPADIDTYL